MPKIVTPIINNELVLCAADGTVMKTIPYRIDALKSYEAIVNARAELAQAIQTNNDAQVGETFVMLMREVFGNEQTDEILEFYGSTEQERHNLVWMVTPILMNEVFPALEAMRAQIVEFKKAMKRYGGND